MFTYRISQKTPCLKKPQQILPAVFTDIKRVSGSRLHLTQETRGKEGREKIKKESKAMEGKRKTLTIPHFRIHDLIQILL